MVKRNDGITSVLYRRLSTSKEVAQYSYIYQSSYLPANLLSISLFTSPSVLYFAIALHYTGPPKLLI